MQMRRCQMRIPFSHDDGGMPCQIPNLDQRHPCHHQSAAEIMTAIVQVEIMQLCEFDK